MVRTESPSSINTYKQCPRKYYYSYIKKLPRPSNIHCIRGNIVHEALEEFYAMDIGDANEANFIPKFSNRLKDLFHEKWDGHRKEMSDMGMSNDEIFGYYQDTLMMLAVWINAIIKRTGQLLEKYSFEDAFYQMKPDLIEQKFVSDYYKVMGYVDCIYLKDGKVKILDYKTSNSADVKPEYQLQLGIYALLFEERYGKLPDELALWFLKHGEVTFPVTEDLIKNAKFEIEQIHLSTTTDDVKDYPRQPGPLCKYSTGQCEFYETCFGLKDSKQPI